MTTREASEIQRHFLPDLAVLTVAYATVKNSRRMLVYSLDFTHAAVSLGVGLVAGAMNAVAGGGTLLTFPTLIWLGLDSVTANATSTKGNHKYGSKNTPKTRSRSLFWC